MALSWLCLFFAVVVATVGVAGIVGVRAATHVGKSVTDDELNTSTATAQLGRSIDIAYAVGQQAVRLGNGPQRAALSEEEYTQLVPRVDAELTGLQLLHADDPPAERRDIVLFASQWAAMRDLLSPDPTPSAGSDAALTVRLAGAYAPLGLHLDRLITKERDDAQADDARAVSRSAVTIWLITAAVLLGVLAALIVARVGARRVRRAVEPEQDQIEFGETLQIATDEEEAHQLLRRHLERMLPDMAAVVLNRNNSADRLEAVTALPPGSPLAASLRGAQPRSCVAVRSGRTHTENADRPGLLGCAVCAVCPGSSNCTPLTVGGEVIGSVLLNGPRPPSVVEVLRVRDSVSQAAPVLANLRNLAVAEIRAATDGLTGLPNKRAVTDTLTRMFAQASRAGSTLTLVLIDLDHFKQINDRYGHPVGDQVLANVGAALRGALRAGDFSGRNGGEEFALLLPDTEVLSGYEIAERVRAAIAEITVPGVDVRVTASLGLAGYPAHANTLERLERLADAALYQAKRSGRNRTDLADSGPEDATPGFAASDHRGTDT